MATRPVSLTTFSTLTGPITEPVSALDTNLANLPLAVDDPVISSNVGTDSGGVNTLACTISPGPSVLDATQQGLIVSVKAGNTNTGAATFNLNGFGAVAIQRGNGFALVGGEIIAGMPCILSWQGSAGKWSIVNPQGVIISPAPSVTSLAQVATTTGLVSTGNYAAPDVAARTINVSGVDQNSYVSGTGTAGVDNTAQTVKSITLKANSLNAVGRRIRISLLYASVGAGAGLWATQLNGVVFDLSQTAAAGRTLEQVFEISYVDNTHANIINKGISGYNTAAGFFGTQAQVNIAGFNFAVDQTLAVTQTQVASYHLTVYEIVVEQLG